MLTIKMPAEKVLAQITSRITWGDRTDDSARERLFRLREMINQHGRTTVLVDEELYKFLDF